MRLSWLLITITIVCRLSTAHGDFSVLLLFDYKYIYYLGICEESKRIHLLKRKKHFFLTEIMNVLIKRYKLQILAKQIFKKRKKFHEGVRKQTVKYKV